MSQYHPLTVKLFDMEGNPYPFQADKIIKDYLQEAAEKLVNTRQFVREAKPLIREILGLTEVKDEPKNHWITCSSNRQPNVACDCNFNNSPEPKESRVRCEIFLFLLEDKWKGCPFCLIPHPTEKPLGERLAILFINHNNEAQEKNKLTSWREYAEMAVHFLQENKEILK